MDWMPEKLRRLVGAIHEANENSRVTLEYVQAMRARFDQEPESAPSNSVQTLELDYPVVARKRPLESSAGGRALARMVEASRPRFEAMLDGLAGFKDRFSAISINGSDPRQPQWKNGMLPALDSALLYAYVATRNPRTYFEIGSGNSTKFVRRAVSDNELRTRIVSIDPCPRAEIDGLCDETIRAPFEDVVGRLQSRIEPGDMLFLDGSHRSFQNSDVTVFFTEFLPALPAGVLYGIHDIFLPLDYPVDWLDRFYNEQYLLMSYLLGGGGGDEIAFPTYAVSGDPSVRERIDELFGWIDNDGIVHHGASFWLTRGGSR